jgi:hypothetical protein
MKVKTKTSGTILYVIGQHLDTNGSIMLYDCVRRDPKFQPHPKVEAQVHPEDVDILEA